ncbi:TPA: hypothetical protein DCX15_04280 [bacterium]|nr:hypothetical protein [bacterium]
MNILLIVLIIAAITTIYVIIFSPPKYEIREDELRIKRRRITVERIPLCEITDVQPGYPPFWNSQYVHPFWSRPDRSRCVTIYHHLGFFQNTVIIPPDPEGFISALKEKLKSITLREEPPSKPLPASFSYHFLKSLLVGLFFSVPSFALGLALSLISLLFALEDIQLFKMLPFIPQDIYQNYVKAPPFFVKFADCIWIFMLFLGLVVLLWMIIGIVLCLKKCNPQRRYYLTIALIRDNWKTFILRGALVLVTGFLLCPFIKKFIPHIILFSFSLWRLTMEWPYANLLLCFGMGLCGMVLPMLIFALYRPNLTPRQFLGRFIPPLILILLFFSARYWVYHDLFPRYDFPKKFWEELNIPTSGFKARKVILFTEEEPMILESELKISPFWVDYEDLAIDASPEYLERLYSHLKGKNYKTTYMEDGIPYILGGYAKNWMLDKMREVEMEFFKEAGCTLSGRRLLGDLRKYPNYSPEILKIIDQLASKEAFYHNPQSYPQGSKLLSDIYLHFGEYNRAKDWYDKAKKDGYKEYGVPRIDLETPRLKAGSVEGRILIEGKEIAGIKVGLRVAEKDETWSILNILNIKERDLDPLVQVGTITDTQGRFSLKNLIGGEYYLVIMADEGVFPEPLSVEGHSGRLNLNVNKPQIDLGIIRIKQG